MKKAGLAVIIAAGLAGSAAAADRVAYQAITAGDFAAAAQQLESERRIYPQRPELMLNLAAAYRGMGRLAEARALYSAVLSRPAVMLDRPNGDPISSRDLAVVGLERTGAALASR
ncbi:tetratricopeptide repeat protein [Sphingomonas sp.]|jgi:Flp pilus assembly protein TadD|uniref:tetratricopeptide repeat protein n=1 Tax=Sphingomonas sp. TaxID=28214 RepID=UPI002D7FDD54|nr:tetratricopeptide repeat protein [Sphingomonas sp.]HEU0044405.1 tetratricopeptide repeat protein [Sphingomonas sp.]